MLSIRLTRQTVDKMIHVVTQLLPQCKSEVQFGPESNSWRPCILRFFWTPESAGCQVAVSTVMYAHSVRAHTHTCADNCSHQSGWQSRRTDYLSTCSRQGTPPDGMLFSLKAAKIVSKRPPLLLTQTNIILHNSVDPDPTVHISLLAKPSVHVITSLTIFQC